MIDLLTSDDEEPPQPPRTASQQSVQQPHRGAAAAASQPPLTAVQQLQQRAGQQGTAVSPAGSQRLSESLPPALCTARAFPDLAHEIFNERQRAEVLAQLRDWLRTTFGAATQVEHQQA